jgi:endonuclease/exonuclease/phosphatase (EEP) superfamily protein YafD
MLDNTKEGAGTHRPLKRWLSGLGILFGGLCVAVLLARLVAGVDGLAQRTGLDGLDYLAPWWFAVLALPTGLLCLWVGRRWTGTTIALLLLALLALEGDWRWPRGVVAPPDSSSLVVLALNASHYEAGLDRVVMGIKSLNPDVVLLSENCREVGSIEQLRTAFAPYTVTLSRSGDMAIASRLPVLSATEVELPSKEPFHRCSRRLKDGVDHPNRSFMHLRVDLHGTTVNLISVRFIAGHAPSTGLADELEWGRYLLATQNGEARFLREYVSRLEGPVIFGGDLNATPTSRLIRGLGAFATDAYLTNHWVGLPTFPTTFPIQRLDYLFAGHGVVATQAERPDLLISDHYPLMASFAVRRDSRPIARDVVAGSDKPL